MAAISHNGTWFEALDRSFTDKSTVKPKDVKDTTEPKEDGKNIIEPDGEISTTEFIRAVKSLATMFDGSGLVLAQVSSDLNNNISKVQERYEATPGKSETLQALVENELRTGVHKAAEGLLWLTRSLDFTFQAFSHDIGDSPQHLYKSFEKAYPETLKKYHGYAAKKLFGSAMGYIPSRQKLYEKLGGNLLTNAVARETNEDMNKEERGIIEKKSREAMMAKVQEQLKEYLAGMGKVVEILKEMKYPDEKWATQAPWF